MKKVILTLFISGSVFTSCMKSKTCTCKDASGTVVSQQTKKTNSKSDLNTFETNCKNAKIETKVNGVVTSSIPCEVS